MLLFGVDINQRPAFIAEVGVNHEGNIKKAIELISLAKGAGADAVKFQSYTTQFYSASDDRERFERVNRFSLPLEQHRELKAHADEQGIEFFSTPLSEDWVEYLDPLVSVFKIGSGDLTFEPVLRAVAMSQKKIILSTGMGNHEEIAKAIEVIQKVRPDQPLSEFLVLMHCVSAYPTPLEEANVSAVVDLATTYGVHAGYSNHVIGMHAPLSAVALGAKVVEVHFTDRKNGRDFRDHQLSFDADDLRIFVDQALKMHSALGGGKKTIMPCEQMNIKAGRKGLIAARNLPAGHKVRDEDVAYARPEKDFGSNDKPLVLGKTLRVGMSSGESILKRHLET